MNDGCQHLAQSFDERFGEIARDSIPVSGLLRTAALSASTVAEFPWWLPLIPMALGLVLVFRRAWGRDRYGRCQLDGLALFIILLLACWNLAGIWGIAELFIANVRDMGGTESASRAWSAIPLWRRSVISPLTIWLLLIGLRKLLQRNPAGLYWMLGVVVCTAGDTLLTLGVSAAVGWTSMASTVGALWVCVTSIASGVFLFRSRALDECLDA